MVRPSRRSSEVTNPRSRPRAAMASLASSMLMPPTVSVATAVAGSSRRVSGSLILPLDLSRSAPKSPISLPDGRADDPLSGCGDRVLPLTGPPPSPLQADELPVQKVVFLRNLERVHSFQLLPHLIGPAL